MKKLNILVIDDTIEKVKDIKSTVRFKYILLKNREIIAPTVKAFREIYSGLNELIKDFEQGRVELIKKYGEAVEDGIKVKEENLDVFKAEFSILSKKWEKELAEYNKGLKEADKLLQEEEEPKLIKLKIEELPEDLTATDINVLLPMIEE